jgi:hypothetical protein
MVPTESDRDWHRHCHGGYHHYHGRARDSSLNASNSDSHSVQQAQPGQELVALSLRLGALNLNLQVRHWQSHCQAVPVGLHLEWEHLRNTCIYLYRLVYASMYNALIYHSSSI